MLHDALNQQLQVRATQGAVESPPALARGEGCGTRRLAVGRPAAGPSHTLYHHGCPGHSGRPAPAQATAAAVLERCIPLLGHEQQGDAAAPSQLSGRPAQLELRAQGARRLSSRCRHNVATAPSQSTGCSVLPTVEILPAVVRRDCQPSYRAGSCHSGRPSRRQPRPAAATARVGRSR